MKPENARLYLECEMEAPELRSFCGGTAAIYSTRSPAKESPNQDAAALLPYSEDRGALVVADGVGGVRGGAQASSTALYEMAACFESSLAGGASLRDAILDGIEGANREVCTLGIGAATTVAVVELSAGRMRPYHVGDSEILVVGSRGKLKLATVAHSPMGYGVESGLIGEAEAMVHEDRHFVSNVVGIPDMRIEMGSAIELAPRDTVLVACDGLFDNLTREEIVEFLRMGSLEEAATALASACRERMQARATPQPSKPDDLTLIVYRT